MWQVENASQILTQLARYDMLRFKYIIYSPKKKFIRHLIHTYVHLHNYFTHSARIGWGLGTEDNVLNFQSAMMYTNNVVFRDLCVMAVVFVILLTPKLFSRPASSPAHASFVV